MKKCGNSEKKVSFYHCEKCDYKCSKKQHWKQHCQTKKHNDYKGLQKGLQKGLHNDYKCECGKKYTKRQNLHRHKKNCTSTELTIYQPEDTITTNNSNSIMEKLMEQLTEQNTNENMECILKQMLVQQAEQNKQQAEQNKIILTQQTEQNKLMIELANKPTIQNNNNQTFNLNTFLNVDCKDAMNIEDFISSIKVSIEDLKDIRTYGFLYSMDIAMMNKLKDMKQIERPIHCTDKKRKKFYIKKNNEWNKDCDQKEVYEIIKDVNMIQRKSFVKWSKDIQAQNPQWSEDMHFYNEVIEILDKLNSLFGVDEDVLKLKKKLFSTIIEYTTIKKSKMNGTNNIYKQGVVGE